MPGGFRIRAATTDDVPALFELIKGLAAYERLLEQLSATEESLRSHLFGARPAAEAVLAEEHGVAVGFALYFHNFSTFLGRPGLYLEDLFVRPEYRGRGYGKALMVFVARLAQARDCGRLEWSVLDWNRPAREFYRTLGARPLDDWIGQRMTGEAIARLAGHRLPGEDG
ncbi:MAG: GNAT family N-acetyltransferase [Betaproteobacteria bacterium]|jgi:GNAT superfamily N-acetyltransferase|nr:GNAT family N-acetyltransferase [Betaproteobacteria bacterium]